MLRPMTLFKTGLRYLLRRPFQSILCILGVALGVAMVIAIDLANGSASRAFELSTETVAGRATHQVVGSGAGLDEDVYRRIKVELGVREAAPVVESYATAIELDQQPLRVLGIDAFADAPFRSYLGEGNAALQQGDLTDFFVRPDAILIGEALARQYGLRVGSAITLRAGDRRQPMRVAGILTPADENSRRALDGLAIVDISTAQELFDMSGRLSHIDLIADERTEAGRTLLERVRSVLPEGAQIVKPRARSQSVESLTDAFRLNLTALSLLALVVGMFLIYNTITFSVVQRRPVIGTLRCLGVTQREIFRQILLETLLLGIIGGVIGIGLGVLLGRGAVGLVSQTINDLYYTVNVRSVTIEPLTLLKGFALGLVASLVAALAPAYEATSIPPITALKRSNVEQRVQRLLPWIALAGVVMFAIGGAMLLLTRALVVNLAGIFFVLIGLAFVSPLLTLALMRLLAPLLDCIVGLVGRMSARNVVNSISRTAIAIASLMVAVSVIIGLQSMIGSFRTTVESWLDASLTADVYVAPPAAGANAGDPTIESAVVEAFEALPDVIDVMLFRRTPVDFRVAVPRAGSGDSMTQPPADYKSAALLAIRSDRERADETFVWTARPANGLWGSMAGRDEVQVSEPFANKHGVTPQNDRLVLRTEQGEREFLVVAVYYDYASDAGVILMRRDTYRRYWRDDKISSLALYIDDARVRDVGAFVEQLRRQFAGRELVISANRELRADALAIFDRTFAITGALNLLAMVVAFIGVLSALMALQIERTRELGVLRANGMTLRQLWRMTLLETGLMGGTAGLLSMPTGFLLALILVYIINLRSFGWTIRLDLQWETFAQAMLVAVISALLAAIYPMLRLGQMEIARAVRQE
ncbi:MAG: permease [Candidatus Roseilinea sp.]|nr:MAG: permease [Candidatus Roseilinea sp.]GIV84010.1 MAG: permease [Candidatus Roseilinea sp.]